MTEQQAIAKLGELAAKKVMRSYLGLGYADCVTPPVILRNILENPGWYTQHSPSSRISQGRLEALLTFQTLIADLTGLEISNSSASRRGHRCGGAMTLCQRVLGRKNKATAFFVSEHVTRRPLP